MSIFRKPKVGLALGSGGGKGLVHIGIIKELLSWGLEIDYISGTSMGALVGGLYAATKDIVLVEDLALSLDSRVMKLFTDISNKTGLIRGSKVVGFFDKYTQGKQIEDLPIKFSAVATDIKEGKTVYLENGDLTQAIRASISIPLVFDPIIINSQLLVDGGTTEPVPIKAVKRLGAKKVIAVNLEHNNFPIKGMVKQKIATSKKTMVNTVVSLMVHNIAEQDCKDADVVITPSLSEVGMIGFGNLLNPARFIKVGQKVAQARQSEIMKLYK